ncbi:MAG: aminotransferase class I/II-fold pyridoxal phosphate-dependent enzyme [Deltaproteobacteria bacterium]|nr:aminotransferase class I/II-fold pyridoxal phosphate-dependent enzyme [Deltaproteobacteria bacterium]
MKILTSKRIIQLPPYLFAELDRLKAERIRKGVDVIDLGVADPDLPTPPHIIAALQRAAEDPANHRYPSYSGLNRFREAAAGWMKRRFGVKVDPLQEVVSLIGSKEGISNFPLAFVDPGDVVLIPSPGYPPTTSGTLFAGGTPYFMPLHRENKFLPDLNAVPESVARQAKVMHLNYPNNPTAATAPRDYYEKVVAFAKKHHSLSKTYNMTGWRIGFACGNLELVAGLGKIKTNIDSGIFQAVQWAGIAALEGDQKCVEGMRQVYRQRRNLMKEGLKKLGWDVASCSGGITLWVATPKCFKSKEFSKKVLEECGVVLTPGNGFGEAGEGYVRISLTCADERLAEALERLKRVQV